MTREAKRDYVRSQVGQPAGPHHCHWPGCNKRVPAAVWGCKRHWFLLPRVLRNRIWDTFRPGQEVSKTPSAEYVAAAKEVRAWITEHYPNGEVP